MPSVHSNEQRSDKKTVVYSRSEHSVNSACLPYQKAVLARTTSGDVSGSNLATLLPYQSLAVADLKVAKNYFEET